MPTRKPALPRTPAAPRLAAAGRPARDSSRRVDAFRKALFQGRLHVDAHAIAARLIAAGVIQARA